LTLPSPDRGGGGRARGRGGAGGRVPQTRPPPPPPPSPPRTEGQVIKRVRQAVGREHDVAVGAAHDAKRAAPGRPLVGGGRGGGRPAWAEMRERSSDRGAPAAARAAGAAARRAARAHRARTLPSSPDLGPARHRPDQVAQRQRLQLAQRPPARLARGGRRGEQVFQRPRRPPPAVAATAQGLQVGLGGRVRVGKAAGEDGGEEFGHRHSKAGRGAAGRRPGGGGRPLGGGRGRGRRARSVLAALAAPACNRAQPAAASRHDPRPYPGRSTVKAGAGFAQPPWTPWRRSRASSSGRCARAGIAAPGGPRGRLPATNVGAR
jgi:translation initiation factor IF-2